MLLVKILLLMIAYEGMRKVDESKIYANQPAIIKYELADIRRLYEQYGTQNKLLEYGSLMVLVDQMKRSKILSKICRL